MQVLIALGSSLHWQLPCFQRENWFQMQGWKPGGCLSLALLSPWFLTTLLRYIFVLVPSPVSGLNSCASLHLHVSGFILQWKCELDLWDVPGPPPPPCTHLVQERPCRCLLSVEQMLPGLIAWEALTDLCI